MAAPTLPKSFPCWVKAIYSYGGETKRDLGFLEGDYIECLNAGDGSWWTGRLKRDPRIIGKFPCNFVKLLDTDSLPPSLAGSPLPPRTRQASRAGSTPPSSGTSTPVKQQKSMFRKPFSAHAAASSPGAQPSPRPTKIENKPKKNFAPYSSMKKFEQQQTPPKTSMERPPSPKIPKPIARGGVPRAGPVSFQPPGQSIDLPSISRSASPIPMQSIETPDSSPPPPPPPAHRIVYGRQGYSEPPQGYRQEYQQSYGTPNGARSPSAELHQHSGFTPSPLRDAMDDVMTSLDGMRVDDEEPSPVEDEHNDPLESSWYPNGYSGAYEQPHKDQYGQAETHYANESDDVFGLEATSSPPEHADRHMPPREDRDAMREYVQRMQSRLERLEEQSQREEDENDEPTRPTSGYSMAAGTRGEFPYGQSRPGSSYGQQSRPGSAYGLQSRPGSSHDRHSRPTSAFGDRARGADSYYNSLRRKLSRRGPKETKSAYELGRSGTVRSSVTTASSNAHSTSTNLTNSTQPTNPSLMSGQSAGGFSATSAGSYARRKLAAGAAARPMSALDPPRPASPMTGYSWHESHASNERAELSFESGATEASRDQSQFGGLTSPAARKKNLFQRLRDTAKTSAASARSNISSNGAREASPRPKSVLANGLTSITGGIAPRDAARDMGLGGTPDRSTGVDWVQMRRDVNRANSLSRNERNERVERCQMLDIPVMAPVDVIGDTTDGDESADGAPVSDPTDFQVGNLAMVDKSARLVSQLPGVINATSLAQTYLCRQYRSDVQRLRAIFTWVAERIAWEEDFEGHRDSRKVITSRRGCAEEIAYLVAEMCVAAGFQAEVVRGYLKTPGEVFGAQDLVDAAARPNHWWNTVVCDGEWRIMDCALASPSNPRRCSYSSANNQVAESWYFLARPTQICYTHVPLLPEQQHILPSMPHDVLLALPTACSPFFKNNCQMWDFDTSLIHLAGLEMAHIQLAVPDDVEINAEVEAHSFARDNDGDFFESGDVERKRALAQAEFVTVPDAPAAPFKRYTIKAVLPSGPDVAAQGVLKIYAGKRGLQRGIDSNPHNLAVALPLVHDGGANPRYDFFARHPTPHALRHELYVQNPLCRTLALNNTFVFSVRQHPATPNAGNGTAAAGRPASPTRPRSAMGLSISRPGSALSMASVSLSGSQYSNPSNSSDGSSGSRPGDDKPAKLAMQSPSGKIMRMNRKTESVRGVIDGDAADVTRVGPVYETIIKIGERGTWRGLVLADRSARWCVFGEWEAV